MVNKEREANMATLNEAFRQHPPRYPPPPPPPAPTAASNYRRASDYRKS